MLCLLTKGKLQNLFILQTFISFHEHDAKTAYLSELYLNLNLKVYFNVGDFGGSKNILG